MRLMELSSIIKKNPFHKSIKRNVISSFTYSLPSLHKIFPITVNENITFKLYGSIKEDIFCNVLSSYHMLLQVELIIFTNQSLYSQVDKLFRIAIHKTINILVFHY